METRNKLTETITLLDEYTGKNSWHLQARVSENGDLIIEGQDLGHCVEQFWGTGYTEYEWEITVRAVHIPKLIVALGGKDGDNVLLLLAARYKDDNRYADKGFFEEQSVPIEFWSRVGD